MSTLSRTTTLSFLAVLLIVLAAAPLCAEDSTESMQRADEYLARGLEHYEARDFEAAITAFLSGHAAEPRPQFLFALGQAERRSGDCESALVYYERFLATRPSGAQVRATRMHIAGCQAALVSGPDGAPVSKSVASPASRPAPWYHDTLGDALLGAGVVSAIAGAGFLIGGELARDRVGVSATYAEHDRHMARAERYRLYGAISLGTAAALAAGAVYRFTHRGDARELAIAPGSGGGLAISYGGRF